MPPYTGAYMRSADGLPVFAPKSPEPPLGTGLPTCSVVYRTLPACYMSACGKEGIANAFPQIQTGNVANVSL